MILIKVITNTFRMSISKIWLVLMTRKIPLQQVKVFQILPLTIRHINCTKPNKMNSLKSKLRVLHEWISPKSSPSVTKLTKALCSSSNCFISGCMWYYCFINNRLMVFFESWPFSNHNRKRNPASIGLTSVVADKLFECVRPFCVVGA